VLTLSGSWRADSGAGAGGRGGAAPSPPRRVSSGESGAGGGVAQAVASGALDGGSPPSPLDWADADAAAARVLALEAPKRLQRLSAGLHEDGGGPLLLRGRGHGRGDGCELGPNLQASVWPRDTAATLASEASAEQAEAPMSQPRDAAGCGGDGASATLLSPEARTALAAGPAPAARAFIEAAADAWPGLRALELPALGRASLYEKEHEELEELAWRAAPRLAALNFLRHYHHL
jgi:hypothetical protein